MEGWELGSINQSVDEGRICSVRLMAEICNCLDLPSWGSSCMVTRRHRGFYYPYCHPEWFPQARDGTSSLIIVFSRSSPCSGGGGVFVYVR